MTREIREAVKPPTKEAVLAGSKILALLNNPQGHPPEQLEDALNELNDAGFRARRAVSAAQLLAAQEDPDRS